MSSLDRAFFKAYAKDQPILAPPASADGGDVSPYVHFESPRKPQLRYRLEPTHAPWGARQPHINVDSLGVPDEELYELIDHAEESHAFAAWGAVERSPLASPAEPEVLPVSEPIIRPTASILLEPVAPAPTTVVEPEPEPPPAPIIPSAPVVPVAKVAPPPAAVDPYAAGIVCPPGWEVPESNYLALVPQEPEPEPLLPPEPIAAPAVAEVAPVRSAPDPVPAPEPIPAPAPEPVVEAKPPLADETTSQWEVDRYLYPVISDRLLREYDYFQHAGIKLKQAASGGLKTLAITGLGRDEGRTTLAICLARAGAAAGLRVGIIDCDFQQPSLAHSLGLEAAEGWQSLLDSQSSLANVAIRSLDDGIVLLPLLDDAATRSLSLADPPVETLIQRAAKTLGLLILDAGPLEPAAIPTGRKACFEAAIVLCDRRHHELPQAEAIARHLAALGVEAVGIAENYSS